MVSLAVQALTCDARHGDAVSREGGPQVRQDACLTQRHLGRNVQVQAVGAGVTRGSVSMRSQWCCYLCRVTQSYQVTLSRAEQTLCSNTANTIHSVHHT